VISRDRYLKRDELGVIYQLCVAPGTQRKLVGASLIAEVFRRSAYGCKLYCCWCAQDIEANYFWESIGFVPIAFRAGGKLKKDPSTGLRAGRVHIFWQRRVHADDVVTPWWYPCATNGGAIREDRLVFPIPPGVRWQDVTAVVTTQSNDEVGLRRAQSSRMLKDETVKKPGASLRRAQSSRSQNPVSKQKRAGEAPAPRARVQFGPPSMTVPVQEAGAKEAPFDNAQGREKRPREKRAKTKNDPALVAKVRELRDRCLEHVNANPAALVAAGKYDVSRCAALPEPVKAAPKALAA
jgi:hypothetical protein